MVSEIKDLIIADNVNMQVYEYLKNLILEQKLKPGQRIDSKRLAEEHSISVMPVRDALQRLTTQGLVITRQRSGFYVRNFSNKELLEINDARKMFELYGLDTHFEKLDIQQAKTLYKRLSDTPAGNQKEMGAIDSILHRLFIYVTENDFLIRQYEDMSCLFSLGMYVGPLNAENAKKEHLEILNSIIKSDKIRALKALSEHLDRVGEEIAQLYSDM